MIYIISSSFDVVFLIDYILRISTFQNIIFVRMILDSRIWIISSYNINVLDIFSEL